MTENEKKIQDIFEESKRNPVIQQPLDPPLPGSVTWQALKSITITQLILITLLQTKGVLDDEEINWLASEEVRKKFAEELEN